MKKLLWITLICIPGLVLQFTQRPALVLLVSGLVIFAALASFGIIAIWLLDKKFFLKHTIGFLPLLFAIAVANTFRLVKEKRATHLQQQIESYKILYGRYPSNLADLNPQDSETNFHYSVDSLGKEYELGYYMDGINRMYYDSASEEWTSYGWND